MGFINRFGGLIRTIRGIFGGGKGQGAGAPIEPEPPGVPYEEEEVGPVDRTREALDHAREVLLEEMRELAPDGSENLDQYGGAPQRDGTFRFMPNRYQNQRPSERHGLNLRGEPWVPIKQGLRSWAEVKAIEYEGVGGRFSIGTDERTPHVRFFTRGFPEKWYGGTPSHRIPTAGTMIATKGYPLGFHWRGVDNWRWTFVENQRIDLNIHGDFVEDAWLNVQYDLMDDLDDMYARHIYDALDSFFDTLG